MQSISGYLYKQTVELIILDSGPLTENTLVYAKPLQIYKGIDNKIRLLTKLEHFYVCPHIDKDNCECRKPKPGNILKAAEKYNIDLKNSYMIGDRWRDIEAGQSAGCKTVFIDYGYDEKRPVNFNFSVSSLLEATQIILGE